MSLTTTESSVGLSESEPAIEVFAAGTDADPSTHYVYLVLIFVVTVVAAVLRFAKLGEVGFRIDEGFTMTFARQPWAGVLGLHGYYDLHPPLFFSLAKFADLFVPETIASRVVAATSGVATIPVFYGFCRRLIDERVALGAALLLTVSPLHIEFSRDGRMYAPVIFCVVVGWLALVAYLQTRRPTWAFTYGLSLLLAMYIDYSAVYALVPQAVVLAIYLVRVRGRDLWLVGSLLGALIGYVPWLPQVYRSVAKSRHHAGRADWLSASWDRIGESIPSLLGMMGRTVTSGGDNRGTWGRLPDWHPVLLLIAFAALAVGLVALRRWPRVAMFVVMLVVLPPLAAIVLSQISPGYAPRTIMASVLGLTILASAFLARGQIGRFVRGFGAVGWAMFLTISLITLPSTYSAGTRTEWPDIAHDLAAQSSMNHPVLVFSTAGMLTDMLDLYGGDRLAGTRIITLLDGPREEEIGYQRWLDRGPQLREIQQGALAGLLPQSDPANDVIWVILRFGGGKIPQYLAQIGYTQIGSIRYTDTDLLLFARPGAQIGSPVQMDPRYSEATGNSDGWRYANKNVAVRAAGAIWEMVLTGDRSVSTYRFTTQSGGLVVGRIDAQVPAGSLAVTMSCVSANGDVLRSSRATSQKNFADWQSISVAGLCPDRTATVEVRFQRRGEGSVILRNAQLEFNPNQN
jgi:Dolichyl-phosphate-mannose-protein mannosyltransferase